MFAKCDDVQSTSFPVDVQQIPQIDHDSTADRNVNEEADIFCRHDAAHVEACQEKPLPPFTTEGVMPLSVELDIAQYTHSHEEDESRIKEDESSLADMRVIEEDKGCGKDAGREGVFRLPHNEEDDGDRESPQQCRKGSVSHIWHSVLNVRVSNVVKQKVTVKAHQPSNKGKQQFGKGRVDVEEVDPL